jgi:hypothetical protein
LLLENRSFDPIPGYRRPFDLLLRAPAVATGDPELDSLNPLDGNISDPSCSPALRGEDETDGPKGEQRQSRRLGDRRGLGIDGDPVAEPAERGPANVIA